MYRLDIGLEHNGFTFGAIEVTQTKYTSAGMSDFLQTLLSLQHVQKNSKIQYIGIFTNGYSFVFFTLRAKMFTFESTSLTTRDAKLKVHKGSTWNDLFIICERAHTLIRKAIEMNASEISN